MSKSTVLLNIQVGLAASAAALSLSVNAADQDVRIGRYQTVTVAGPVQEIAVTPLLRSTPIPDDVTTRAAALQWILQQHGYRLHEDTQLLLAVVQFLAAPIPSQERQLPAERLPGVLQSLLGSQLDVFVDTTTKKVALFPNAGPAVATGGRNGSD